MRRRLCHWRRLTMPWPSWHKTRLMVSSYRIRRLIVTWVRVHNLRLQRPLCQVKRMVLQSWWPRMRLCCKVRLITSWKSMLSVPHWISGAMKQLHWWTTRNHSLKSTTLTLLRERLIRLAWLWLVCSSELFWVFCWRWWSFQALSH